MLPENKIVFESGVNQYNQAKPDGDIDLVEKVRELLIGAGLYQNVVNCYNTNHFIIEATGKTSEVQRYLLNRYWNIQLMTTTNPSIEERYCLIPNGQISEWLTLFQAKVLPFILVNNLPVGT
jgi:hypothetical protein